MSFKTNTSDGERSVTLARIRNTDFIATVSVNRWYAMDRNGSTGGSDLSFTSEAPNEVEKAYDLRAAGPAS